MQRSERGGRIAGKETEAAFAQIRNVLGGFRSANDLNEVLAQHRMWFPFCRFPAGNQTVGLLLRPVRVRLAQGFAATFRSSSRHGKSRSQWGQWASHAGQLLQMPPEQE